VCNHQKQKCFGADSFTEQVRHQQKRLAMTYTDPHALLTVHGELTGTPERWSFGLRFLPASSGPQASADQALTIVSTWWTTGTNHFSAGLKLTHVKVANIEPDGHYPPTGLSAEAVLAVPLQGTDLTTQGLYVPPQSSVAVTLTTDVPRGLASKGRVYLPSQVFQIDQGLISVAAAQAVANNFKGMITSLNAASLWGNAQVMSRGKADRSTDPATGKTTYTYPNPGVTHDILGCRVGRVVDTQRRRRRQLTELPVSAV
jgi:hypothetical protein